MKTLKRTALFIAINAIGLSFAAASNNGPTINISGNSAQSLQFPRSVEQVSISNSSVAVAEATGNSLLISPLSAGSAEVEFLLAGENTPRYLTINIDGHTHSTSEPQPIPTPEPVSVVEVAEAPAAIQQTAAPEPEPVISHSDTWETVELVSEPVESISDWETGIAATTAEQISEDATQDAPSSYVTEKDLHTPDFVANFDDVAKSALQNNPAVQAKWNMLFAAGTDIDYSKAGFLPTLDLSASISEQRRSGSGTTGSTSFSGSTAELRLVQSLFEGFRTVHEVDRSKHIELVRYFEFIDSVETTLLDAYVAYQDVLRYRELVDLAEHSLEVHEEIFDKVQTSAQAGVARRADLEQISGRLSLAQSNLSNEKSNLHDVTTRFLRITGQLPPVNPDPVFLPEEEIPTDFRSAMHIAYQENPSFHAAIRNVDVKMSETQISKANFLPRVNLVASTGTRDYNDTGSTGRINDSRIALEFNYNLFNGKRDTASLDRSHYELNIAKNERDLACFNIRQELQLRHNNMLSLEERLPSLQQHQLSSDRVRVAFRDQFDIGQRNLLDLLDIENEYFDASRSYITALYDRNISTARTLAVLGKLLPSLDIIRLPTLADMNATHHEVDPQSACPDIDIRASSSHYL